jgi:ferric-dicitrate binding protein FerR (iron transport regulator)
MKNLNKNPFDSWMENLQSNDGIPTSNNQDEFIEISERQMKNISSFKNIDKTNTEAAWNKLRSRLENDGLLPNKKNEKTFRIRRIATIAASIALLVTLGYFLFENGTTKEKMISFETSKEEGVKQVTLPDGSLITLNSNSHIEYPESFGKTNRNLKLSGVAFFEIAKDKQNPFIIDAGNASIRVTGTQFNVSATADNTEIAVTEGHVIFSDKNNSQTKTQLSAGDYARFSGKKMEKKRFDNTNFMSWKTGLFIIEENTNLRKVAEDLSRAYNVCILFSEQSIGEIRPAATTFEKYSLETILEILCTQSDLVYSIDKDCMILMKKK